MLDSPRGWRYQSAVLVGPRLVPSPFGWPSRRPRLDEGEGGLPFLGWEGPAPCADSPRNPARIVLRRNLLMQAYGSLQVSPKNGVALPFGTGELCPFPAGVAQPVEHLFCKQVVRGSSPLASSTCESVRSATRDQDVHRFSEGCPSGQREQAVNLPDLSYVGSNPTPSTRSVSSLSILSARTTERTSAAALRSPRRVPAGVAQLVERQPSKLNVVGSSPISRSAAVSWGRHAPPPSSQVGWDEPPSTRATTSSLLVTRKTALSSSSAATLAGQPPQLRRMRVLRNVSGPAAVRGSLVDLVRKALPIARSVQGSAPLQFPLPT
jgi:hypothetical protein